MKPLEKTIEQYLCRRVRDDLDGWALKLTCPGVAGVPDRLILLPGGRMLMVECKRPGEIPRALQLRRIAQLRALGVVVRVVNSKEAVDALIRELLPGGGDLHDL